jgi:hypothetical protein
MKTLLLSLLMLAPPQAPPLAVAAERPPQAPAVESLQFLILSRTACVPCANQKAELKANGSAGDYPQWDIFTNRPDLDALHEITAYPTILLLRNGKEISRHVGYLSASDLLRWMDNPDQPQSRTESVAKPTYAAARPIYRQIMRYAAPVGCGT